MEYNFLLDKASYQQNSIDRLTYIAVHAATFFTTAERANMKPFNPILGETYEYKCNDFEFFSEQVSHHPPVTACYCKGKNYTYFTNQKTNTHFTGTVLEFHQQFRSYVDLDNFNERYEIVHPVLSAHNLLVGTMYIDLGGTLTVTNLNRPNEKCQIRFDRRGWFSGEPFKIEGSVFMEDGKKKDKKVYITGNWNKKIYI